jgi:nicotinate-nucleotide adenylyltransferase
MMTMNRIGVLGGSFNPPHLAHLQAAQIAARELDLDEVLVVPCAVPAHKQLEGDPGAHGRLALSEAMASCDPLLRVDTLEFDRPGPSYTADTMAILSQRMPSSELHFIVGFDQAMTIGSWEGASELLNLAALAVVPRDDLSWGPVERELHRIGANFQILSQPPDSMSSTLVRASLLAGDDRWRAWVPAPVASLIDLWGLYGSAPSPQQPSLSSAACAFGRLAAASL